MINKLSSLEGPEVQPPLITDLDGSRDAILDDQHKSNLLWIHIPDLQCPSISLAGSFQHYFNVRSVDPATVKACSITTSNIDSLCFEIDKPTDHALDIITRFAAKYPNLPIIIITLEHSESLAIWAIRQHIFEFFYKPLEPIHIERIQANLNSLKQHDRHIRAEDIEHSLHAEDPLGLNQVHSNDYKYSKDKPVLDMALSYVIKNYAEKIYDSDVAELCHITNFQLRRVFHRQFNMTFQEYVCKYRIETAKQLLKRSRVSVSSVAYQVGFTDPSYFTRVFKQSCQLSPKQFQAQFHDH
ncbi:MAG: helix-turn-helix domain-containing protein [Pseudomonadales bacterium]|nr:helix-turn-helix domain-containing protein [Pseudomonadales bacterium]